VKSRFQNLPFKFNLQRYTTASRPTVLQTAAFNHAKTGVFTLSAWVRPAAGKPAAGQRSAVVSLCDAAKAGPGGGGVYKLL
jgi:hypothetical protein